jgi:acylphosphatase
VAEGNKEELAQLIAKLRVGLRAARVERVEVKRGEYSGKYRGFDVMY